MMIVFNISLNRGIFPNEMKLATVIPIFKSGKKEYCNNYQPISLLPVLSKFLEKIVHKRTYNYLSTHEILSKFTIWVQE